MNKTYTLNTAPSLTWNWLKSNNDLVQIDLENAFEKISAGYKELPEGIQVSSKAVKTELKAPLSAVFNIPNPKFGDEPMKAQNARVTTAAKEASENFSDFISSGEKAQIFEINGIVNKPFVLTFNAASNQISQQIIHVNANAQADIIFLYTGSNDSAVNQIIQTKIIAEESSKVHIYKIQLLGKNTLQLDDTQFSAGDNAQIKFTQVELGGKHIVSGLHTSLYGYQASFKSNVAYLCKDEQFLDMNHIVYHYGKKTECDMKVTGTLKDNSAKAYRGTIDLKNGCSGSKGNEMEETLLLSPKAVNKSLPVILCDEEDVEGEHGATIGRLSSDILFYMESRGIDEKQAEIIISRAKIQAVSDSLPDESVSQMISDWLDKNTVEKE